MRAEGLPTPLGGEEASLPSLSPQRGGSYSGGGGCVGSHPPGIAVPPGQAGAPLLSGGLVTPGPPCSCEADGPVWIALQPPLGTARWFGPQGSRARPPLLPPGCEGRRESRAELSREGSGQATAGAPPSEARAPPLRGGVRRGAAVEARTQNPKEQAYWFRS